MQDTTNIHGVTMREFFGEDEAVVKYKEAIFNPKVKEIRQVLGIGRNDPCPCNSGLKFKKCCISKVNKGPEVIEQEGR